MKPIAGILLFLLSSWSMGAWAAECRCEYPDKPALEAAARTIIGDFLAQAAQVGGPDADTLHVTVEATPQLIFIRFEDRSVTVPWWDDLPPPVHDLFSRVAGGEASGRRLFDLLFQQFLIPHEAAHWVQYRLGRYDGGSNYRHEADANRMATAYWAGTDGGEAYLAELEALLAVVVERVPDPTPAGTDPAEYFDTHYDTLAEDPMKYGYYQFRFMLDAIRQRDRLSLADLVLQPT